MSDNGFIITTDMIEEGWDVGLVRLDQAPDFPDSLVCWIGEGYFFFSDAARIDTTYYGDGQLHDDYDLIIDDICYELDEIYGSDYEEWEYYNYILTELPDLDLPLSGAEDYETYDYDDVYNRRNAAYDAYTNARNSYNASAYQAGYSAGQANAYGGSLSGTQGQNIPAPQPQQQQQRPRQRTISRPQAYANGFASLLGIGPIFR